MDKDLPNWPRNTLGHHRERVSQYGVNLKSVALAFAHQNKLDSVSKLHVDGAHSALAKAGLDCEKWYKRSELKVGAGTLFVSLSLGSFSLGPFFFPKNESSAYILTAIILFVCAILGLILVFWGWIQGNFPTTLTLDTTRRRLLCWPWSNCQNQTQCQADDE